MNPRLIDIVIIKLEKQFPRIREEIDKQIDEEFPQIQSDLSYIKKAHCYFSELDGPFDREQKIMFIAFILLNYYPEKILEYKDLKSRPGFLTTLVETLNVSENIIRGYMIQACNLFKHDTHGFRKTIMDIQKVHSQEIFTVTSTTLDSKL